jgi:hypothetical protein
VCEGFDRLESGDLGTSDGSLFLINAADFSVTYIRTGPLGCHMVVR